MKPLGNGQDKGKKLVEQEDGFLPEATPKSGKTEWEKPGYLPFSLENFS